MVVSKICRMVDQLWSTYSASEVLVVP
jgi:hypothetical protein